MYENITYAELKSLPREQKIEALKELMALHSSQKKIAEKLGVNPPNIYNMIARYIRDDGEGKQDSKRGRMKKRDAGDEHNRLKADKAKAAGSAPGTGMKSSIANQAKEISSGAAEKEPMEAGLAAGEPAAAVSAAARNVSGETAGNGSFRNDLLEAEDNVTYVIDNLRNKSDRDRESYNQNDFLISISKELTGEEAQALLAGIGNIFFRDREYRIDIRITEK